MPDQPSRSELRRWASLHLIDPPDFSNPAEVEAFLEAYARLVLNQAQNKPDA